MAGQKHQTLLVSRYEDQVQEINTLHTNRKLFPQLQLPRKVKAIKGIEKALQQKDQDVIFLAVPFQALGEVFSKIKPHLTPNTSVISCAKGLDLESSKTGSQLFEQFFGSKQQYGILSGPNFAGDIIKRDITATVIASLDPKIGKKCATALENNFFYVEYSHDVIGVEICGALKNILAMASGIHQSLDLGENSKALLFTRGLNELAQLSQKLGGEDQTLWGMSGLGDMMLTAGSMNSRNYQLGVWIGAGYSVDEALHKINSTVESIHTVKSAYQMMNDLHLNLPIVETIYRLIQGDTIPKDELVYQLLIKPASQNERFQHHQKLFDI